MMTSLFGICLILGVTDIPQFHKEQYYITLHYMYPLQWYLHLVMVEGLEFQ